VLGDLFRSKTNLVLLMSRGHRYGSTVELHVGDLGIGPGRRLPQEHLRTDRRRGR
jgi:hypothetical protein